MISVFFQTLKSLSYYYSKILEFNIIYTNGPRTNLYINLHIHATIFVRVLWIWFVWIWTCWIGWIWVNRVVLVTKTTNLSYFQFINIVTKKRKLHRAHFCSKTIIIVSIPIDIIREIFSSCIRRKASKARWQYPNRCGRSFRQKCCDSQIQR